MHAILGRINKFTVRVTLLLFGLVGLTILVMASLGFSKLYEATENDASIRIDRAARAAATIFGANFGEDFTIVRDENGRPNAIRIIDGSVDDALTFRPKYDAILKDIGATNQGAANLFKLNAQTQGFDRFATTFRKPDGSMPPPMSIVAGHPAYANLAANQVHIGEVPVMGRLRLAFLIPIQTTQGAVAGALAVDVGWVDDLLVARNELQKLFLGSAIGILALVAGLGIWRMTVELRPLVRLSALAHDLANGKTTRRVPFLDRTDEVGTLASGLERVVEVQRELAYLAYTDELTELGNRARYLADLRTVAAKCNNNDEKWLLLHIDLDRFADANISFGQSGGDELLKQVGTAISEIAGPNAFVSRVAGDRFAILMRCNDDKANNVALSTHVFERLSAPFCLNGSKVYLTTSIGVARLPIDGKSADEAHLNADLALRKAKTEDGNSVAVFSPDMYEAVQSQIELERLLHEAIDDREIDVHFQPQIALSDGTLTGVEALARWPHAEKGMIAPDQFIPVAESTGLIVGLGALVLDKTCAQAAAWLDKGFDFKTVSVNVSPYQLWQPDFVATVRNALTKYDLAPNRLCIEVTENLFIDHEEERVCAILRALKALGVLLSLDDFGSGYSSLGYLNRLPFDELKIDRSFIMDLDKDERNQKLLAGIVSLGQGLGLSVVAEGAETKEEIEFLRNIGCDSVQGYFYVKPMQARTIPNAVSKIVVPEMAVTAKRA